MKTNRRAAAKSTTGRKSAKSKGAPKALPVMLADIVSRLAGCANVQVNRGLDALVPVVRAAAAPAVEPVADVEAAVELTDADLEIDAARTIMGLLGPRTASRVAITTALMRTGLSWAAATLATREAVACGLLVLRVPTRASGGWCVSALAV
jgi:hypothetical protein